MTSQFPNTVRVEQHERELAGVERHLTRPAGDVYARIEAVAGLPQGAAEQACERLRTEYGLAVQTFGEEKAIVKALIALNLLPEVPAPARPTYRGDRIYSENLQADLIVARRIRSGRSGHEEIRATTDGRDYLTEWHNCDTDGNLTEDVYVERIENGSVVFHGWADAKSRKLTQTG